MFSLLALSGALNSACSRNLYYFSSRAVRPSMTRGWGACHFLSKNVDRLELLIGTRCSRLSASSRGHYSSITRGSARHGKRTFEISQNTNCNGANTTAGTLGFFLHSKKGHSMFVATHTSIMSSFRGHLGFTSSWSHVVRFHLKYVDVYIFSLAPQRCADL